MTETATGTIIQAKISFSGKAESNFFVIVSKANTYEEFRGVYLTPEVEKWKKEYAPLLIDNNKLEWGEIKAPLYAIPSRMATIHSSLVTQKLGKINIDTIGLLLRAIVTAEVVNHYNAVHLPKRGTFIPGKTKVNYAGRVYDEKEIVNLVCSSLDFWLTAGPYANTLEKQFKDFYGAEKFLLVNSGSSANLLMAATLCSKQLKEHLKPGDEVITPAVTFPTTLTPLLQYQLTPVFVDCEIGTYNIIAEEIEGAISERTRAIFVPHTLGNPCDMEIIVDVAERHNLFLLEDSCDALGATFGGKLVGTFGDMASLSFYPAHHITMGEGGGVVVNNTEMARIALSIRDWGRDCWCDTGKNNTCGKRFEQQWGELPFGYDHKYVYSNIGYNLKITDMQAAVGCAQFEKIDTFITKRKQNYTKYFNFLKELEEFLILPQHHKKANPSWFGFPITVKKGVNRKKLIKYLDSFGIETRLVFAGNILRQPGFLDIPKRIHGKLENTERIMNDTFFLGVYPGATDQMIEYVVDKIADFFK